VLLTKIRQGEQFVLQPGMIFQISELSFIVERFNMGVVSKIGNRTHMEDSYIVTHDIGLDGCLKASYYSVVDGHGGDWCSEFLQNQLIVYLNQAFHSVD
jgi:serine/threonine protein phosphatase PrpC